MDAKWHYSKLLWLMLTATSLLMNACASPAAVPVPKAPTPARVATPVPAAGPAQSTIAAQHVEAPAPTAATAAQAESPAPTAGQAPRSTGPSVLRLNLGEGDVTTIDPVRAYDVGSGLIVDETFIGLTRLNPVTSALEPGLASSWDISPDGLVYTFHLRPDVPWVHYRAGKVAKVQTCPDAQGQTQDRLVTAHDFAYGILRALNPATAADWGHILADAIAGGEPFNTGKITDTAKVGVKVLNPQTLQIRFNQPEAYNADIAGVSGAAAQPRWLIEGDACTEAQNDRWTEPGALQSYGPYALKDWTHEASLTLVKNPFWPAGIANIPQPRIDELAFRMLGNEAAFTEYEAGNLDIAAVPPGDIDRVKTDPQLSKQLAMAPAWCTTYFGFNNRGAVVSDARVRQALSLAIDRQALVENVLRGGQQAAQWFTRPGLPGAPTLQDYPELGVKFAPARAKDLLASYLKDQGTSADKIDLTLSIAGDFFSPKLAEAIQQMWRDNLGLNVKIDNQEFKAHLQSVMSAQSPQIWSLGWCADYPDANNFTREVLAPGGAANPGPGGLNWQNAQYADLVDRAAREADPARRVKLYAQAEDIAVAKDAALIPLYWQATVNAVKPYVSGPAGTLGLGRFELWDVAAAR